MCRFRENFARETANLYMSEKYNVMVFVSIHRFLKFHACFLYNFCNGAGFLFFQIYIFYNKEYESGCASSIVIHVRERNNTMELFTSMNRLNRFYIAQVNEICTPRKMTSMQFHILRYIFRYENCTSMDIVKAWKVEKPTVSEHIRRLHDKDWIAISQGVDKRVKNLSLTPAGHAVHEEILKEVKEMQKQVTASFTDEEIELFTGFMVRLEEEMLALD